MRPYSGASGDLETFRCHGEFQTPIQEYPCRFHLLCETPVQGIRASGPRSPARLTSRRALSSQIRERPLETRHPLVLTYEGELVFESIKRVGMSANPAYPTVPVKGSAVLGAGGAPGSAPFGPERSRLSDLRCRQELLPEIVKGPSQVPDGIADRGEPVPRQGLSPGGAPGDKRDAGRSPSASAEKPALFKNHRPHHRRLRVPFQLVQKTHYAGGHGLLPRSWLQAPARPNVPRGRLQHGTGQQVIEYPHLDQEGPDPLGTAWAVQLGEPRFPKRS